MLSHRGATVRMEQADARSVPNSVAHTVTQPAVVTHLPPLRVWDPTCSTVVGERVQRPLLLGTCDSCAALVSALALISPPASQCPWAQGR